MAIFLETLRFFTTVSSLLLTVSPWPEARGMIRAKSVGPLTVLPLVMLFCNSYMWTVYGILVRQLFPLIATCSTGQCTSAFFIGIYYKYSSDRAGVRRVLFRTAAVLGAATLWTVLGAYGFTGQPFERVVQTQGIMAIMANLGLYAAPLDTMKRVIQLRNAESLPISLCLVNLLNGTLWVAFGLTERDYFVLTPNAIGSVLSAAQVALYIKYPPRQQPEAEPQPKFALPSVTKPGYDTLPSLQSKPVPAAVPVLATGAAPVAVVDIRDENERQPLLVAATAN